MRIVTKGWNYHPRAPILLFGLVALALISNVWLPLVSLILALCWLAFISDWKCLAQSIINIVLLFLLGCLAWPSHPSSFGIFEAVPPPVKHHLACTSLTLSVLPMAELWAPTSAVAIVDGSSPSTTSRKTSIFTRQSLPDTHRVTSEWFSCRWRHWQAGVSFLLDCVCVVFCRGVCFVLIPRNYCIGTCAREAAKDEWDFWGIGMSNHPFIKANYPHHEGIWGWQGEADQVVMMICNIRKSMTECECASGFNLFYSQVYLIGGRF